jgi:hypothetical protein
VQRAASAQSGGDSRRRADRAERKRGRREADCSTAN